MKHSPRRNKLFMITGFSRPGAGPALGEAAALLMVRPTGVELCASHADEHHIADTVADVAFRGRGYEHAIDIPGHGRLTSVFSDTRAERGEHVGLRLDPRGCHLFSAGPAAAARPAAGRQPAPRPPGRERRRSLLDGHVWNGAGHVRTGRPGSSRCLTLGQSMRDA